MWNRIRRYLQRPSCSHLHKELDIETLLRTSECGIYKRIDEHRELLMLLQKHVPELLRQEPWIIGWIARQDAFLCRLANTLHHTPKGFYGLGPFPRPWPGLSDIPRIELVPPPDEVPLHPQHTLYNDTLFPTANNASYHNNEPERSR